MTRRKILVVAGVIIALAGIGGMGAVNSTKSSSEMPESSRLLPVQTITVQESDGISIQRMYTGVIEAGRASELGFELTGKLKRVLVDEGDSVVAGQLLAELEIDALAARKSQLSAERAQAMAVLAELKAGPRDEQIAAAGAEVASLTAQWQLAQNTRQRTDDLLSKRVVSQEEYDRDAFGLQVARARLDAAQRRLDELEAGTRVEQIDAQRAAVARLDAMVNQVELDIDDSYLYAPFDGVIAARYLDEGTVAAQGTSVVRILDRENLEAWIGLPPEEIAGVRTGQRLQLHIGSRQYDATICRILPELHARTRTRSLVLTFDATHEELVPGTVVRMPYVAHQSDAAFRIPMAALTRGDRGLWSVLAVVRVEGADSSKVERRDIELLHTDGDHAFVRGMLAPGDRIVANGTHRLVTGQRVQVLDGTSPNRRVALQQ